MLRTLRGASSRIVARVVGSRFAKPVARAAVATAGLLLLAFIGRTAVSGAMAASTPVASASAALASPTPPPLPTLLAAPPPAAPPATAELVLPTVQVATAGSTASTRTSHTQATPDDPVFLNTATTEDLRRLPGIGEKRATSIVALRTRLGGRFHAVEDLLKVKGIGRTSLKRLRPLVRLDPPPMLDAGTPP